MHVTDPTQTPRADGRLQQIDRQLATSRTAFERLAGEAQQIEQADRRRREQLAREHDAGAAQRLAEQQAAAEALERRSAERLQVVQEARQRRAGWIERARQRLRQACLAERDRALAACGRGEAAAADDAVSAATAQWGRITGGLQEARADLAAARERIGATAVAEAEVGGVRLPAEPGAALQALAGAIAALRQEAQALAPHRPWREGRPWLQALAHLLAIAAAAAAALTVWQRGWPVIGYLVILLGWAAAVVVINVVGGQRRRHRRQRHRELAARCRGLQRALDLTEPQLRGRYHPDGVIGRRVGDLLAAEEAREQRQEALRQQASERLAAIDERAQALGRRLAGWYDQARVAVEVAAQAERAAWEEAQAAATEQWQDQGGRADRAAAAQRNELVRAVRDEALAHHQGLVAFCQREWQAGQAVRQPWPELIAGERLPEELPQRLPLGRIEAAGGSLLQGAPIEAEDQLLTLPIDLVLPDQGNLLIRSGEPGRAAAIELLQQALLRFLATCPAGKARCTLIDPVGLGEHFASLAGLADADDHLIGRQIWTRPMDIEAQLEDCTAHIEKVIQKFLRGRHASLADFNAAAGDLAQPYRVLVLTDLPRGLTERAAELLQAVLRSGPRCGVFVWVHHRRDEAAPAGIDFERWSDHGVVIDHAPTGLRVQGEAVADWTFRPAMPPQGAVLAALLDRLARATARASGVAVPFLTGTPPADRRWQRDSATELRLPIGMAGADRLQELCLGQGTAQHVLIGGRTGSGKSTLLHVLVTNLALWYGPDQAECYLIDFKKGVEFQRFAAAGLPHARVVGIESDREFGLSVLRHLDRELDQRGMRFRAAGVQDLAGFRAARPDERMPRSLLVIDEFHEFFSEDDVIARDAALLLDRFVRQGRAFGIHIVLGSQTLAGSTALAKSTLSQIGIRIALQCSEADSYLLLADDNPAARMLDRPGEAIYNDRSGRRDGNQPFQVFWLDEADQAAHLATAAAAPGAAALEPPFVFAGNQPARLAGNAALRAAPAAGPVAGPWTWWLGEPNAIKPATALQLGRGAAGNCAIVGQHREAALGMLAAGILAATAQRAPEDLRVLVIDGDQRDDRAAELLGTLAAHCPAVEIVDRPALPALVQGLASELGDAADGRSRSGPEVLLVVVDLARVKALRQSDDPFALPDPDSASGPAEHFAEILAHGPDQGIHVVCWCDSVAGFQRALGRRATKHVGCRIAFQMSPADSSELLDETAASRLGLHHALLQIDEAGISEKFRPYLAPTREEIAVLRAQPRSSDTTATGGSRTQSG